MTDVLGCDRHGADTRMSSDKANVIVAGTGPVGLMAALAFSKAGFGVDLIGPPASRTDGRTTALMTPALAFLDGLDLLDPIRPQSAPLRVMRIVDATSCAGPSPVTNSTSCASRARWSEVATIDSTPSRPSRVTPALSAPIADATASMNVGDETAAPSRRARPPRRAA